MLAGSTDSGTASPRVTDLPPNRPITWQDDYQVEFAVEYADGGVSPHGLGDRALATARAEAAWITRQAARPFPWGIWARKVAPVRVISRSYTTEVTSSAWRPV